ncbi:MAG: hypothetical protein ACLURP_10100 [Ruminococcus sp.]
MYDKVSLMRTIVSQMIERDLSSEQKSIVVRCVEEVYKEFLEKPRTAKAPTVKEFL